MKKISVKFSDEQLIIIELSKKNKETTSDVIRRLVVNGQTVRRSDGQTVRRSDGQTVRRSDGQTEDGLSDEQSNKEYLKNLKLGPPDDYIEEEEEELMI